MAERTGTRSVKYITAVTRTDGDKTRWKEHAPFLNLLDEDPIEVIDLRQLLAPVLPGLTTTVAKPTLAVCCRLIMASGVNIEI